MAMPSINWRRGFFRFWAVLALLWIIPTGAFSVAYVGGDIVASSVPKDWVAKLPTLCSEARGKRGADYLTYGGKCWYDLPDVRRKFPEYSKAPDDSLRRIFFAKAGQALPGFPWSKFFASLIIVMGPPAALLVVGAVIGWIISGFRWA